MDYVKRPEIGLKGVVYLPPLSPRYNPVEYVFSFVKQKIRKDAPRTREQLEASIHGAFAAITPKSMSGAEVPRPEAYANS